MKVRMIGMLVALLTMVSCTPKTEHMMNQEAFQKANIGMSEENLVKTYGEPLNKHYHDNGIVVYEYVERFTMGAAEQRIVEARRYYFYIKEGKVISKQMAIKNQPPYEPMNGVQP